MSDTTPDGNKPLLFIGLNMPGRHGASDPLVIEQTLSQGYDMITGRITNRRYRNRVIASYTGADGSFSRSTSYSVDDKDLSGNEHSSRLSDSIYSHTSRYSDISSPPPNNRGPVPFPESSDVTIFPGPHVSNTIGLAAPWIELDSKDADLANMSYQALKHEILYANFCGLKYVILSGPKRRSHASQYAESVCKLLRLVPQMELAVHLPFTEEYDYDTQNVLVPPPDLFSVWDVWNTIRTMCNYPKNLSIALQVPRFAPSDVVVKRWLAESVSMLVFTPKAFVPNAKKYPVISKAMQQILFIFFKRSPFLLVEEPPELEEQEQIEKTPNDDQEPRFYGGKDSLLKYLRYLHQVSPASTSIEEYAGEMADVLQIPLQPLSDDLESAFYQVFEKDQVKYSQYEKALFYAMQDRPDQAELTVAVVGAGRGPIVDCCIRAAKAAGNRPIKIFALEKNQNALIYLQKRLEAEWSADNKNVEVISTDARSWRPPSSVRFNIIVSELLGSFGDNELSPECLSHIQKYLATDGVMIPRNYRSYVMPVFSPRLHTLACDFQPINRAYSEPTVQFTQDPTNHSSNNASLQVPYVVFMQQYDPISNDTKTAWDFEHPNDGLHNRRCRISFRANHRSVIHGIAGYFEATLYNDVYLSTRPESSTSSMLSWFPMFFPISQPLFVTDDAEIVVTMWRQVEKSRVWYEWTVETFYKKQRIGSSIVHNSSGNHHNMML